ncbi:MAG TPA: VWA domain-containing protein [Candidatus Acidoferrum sp.]|nr:VWA domain-containing protein [Candidatus Acidoferrum sp.]
MFRSLPSPGSKHILLAFLACCFFSLATLAGPLFAQDPPPQNPPPPANPPAANPDSATKPPQEAPAREAQEVSSQDTPATFKVRVNNVLVRVVVRDSRGKVVPNLKKEDFQLYDGRKLQTITSFAIENPRTHSVPLTTSPEPGAPSSDADPAAVKAAVLPQRFVSMVFDDLHMSMQDAVFVRDSATRFFSALAPSDRVSMNTTSGQLNQDFTDDHSVLEKALLGIVPRPLSHHDINDCPDIPYYQADLIANKNETEALAVATEDTVQCAFNGDERMQAAAQSQAQVMAQRVVSEGDSETEYAYRHLEAILRRMTSLPGQRVMVLVSPGFIMSTLQYDASDLVDRATRANVVINTIDARGLYSPDVMGDIANPPRDSIHTAGYKATYRVAAQSAQEDVLAEFADGTGGKFYHNRNDVDAAMREAGAAPEVSYVLGFAPQNLKFDGRFHTLKVALTTKEKFNLQARHGYFAPRSASDPAQITKEEIQEALFSQEEILDIPVDLQTQYFKNNQAGARLSVLTHLDVKGVRFRKALGRNNDQLTIVTGIFDENGQYVTGVEKIIDMKLRDTTFERLSRSGLTVKSSFDVKPGAYLVRLVVRDAEGAQMAARNGAVVIPN